MFIGSRKKLGYINGKTEEPSEATFEKWESENLTVLFLISVRAYFSSVRQRRYGIQ